MVPPDRRVCGEGASSVMAPFSHYNRQGTRFTDGSFGAYYAGNVLDVALAETAYHMGQFYALTNDPPHEEDFRVLVGGVDANLRDLRNQPDCEKYLDPNDYGPSQGLAKLLREEGEDGLVFPSVRCKGGECIAVFWPDVIKIPVQERHLTYYWDGRSVSKYFDHAIGAWNVIPDSADGTVRSGTVTAPNIVPFPIHEASTGGVLCHPLGVRFPKLYKATAVLTAEHIADFGLQDDPDIQPGTYHYYTLEKAENIVGDVTWETVTYLLPEEHRDSLVIRLHETLEHAYGYSEAADDRFIGNDEREVDKTVFRTEEGIFTMIRIPTLPSWPGPVVIHLAKVPSDYPLGWDYWSHIVGPNGSVLPGEPFGL